MPAEYPKKKMTADQQERVSGVLTRLACLATLVNSAGALWFDFAMPVRWALLVLAIVLLAVGLVFLYLSRRRRQ